MANDKTIRFFTALDIERYHKGLLSHKERHDLEKAALDDPFLADALEGYAVTGVDAKADIIALKNRLAEKTTQAKVVPLHSGKRSFPWFRVAAMVILVAGAGVLGYQLVFNKKQEPGIAQAKQNKDVSSLAADTNKTQHVATTPAAEQVTGSTSNNFSGDGAEVNDMKETTEGKAAKSSVSETSVSPSVSDPRGYADITVSAPATRKKDTVTIKEDVAANTNPQFGASELSKTTVPVKKEELRDFEKDKAIDREKEKVAVTDGYTLEDKQKNLGITSKSAPAGNRRAAAEYYNYSNTFRGLVTDANNNALPFANVTNVQDNIGTYADAKGNFILTSTDSILNVQVRSNGFNNTNIQLRNNIPSTQIVLQEDKNLAVQTLRTSKVNYERRRNGNMKLEGEPEPEDGWDNYDSYLSNNLNIDDDALRGRQNTGGSVDVSFEVNKDGEPVNFKIEKSLCTKCDQEAIRLIKAGPKWKRKARKGRTTVTISF
jgi:hypothetical protein